MILLVCFFPLLFVLHFDFHVGAFFLHLRVCCGVCMWRTGYILASLCTRFLFLFFTCLAPPSPLSPFSSSTFFSLLLHPSYGYNTFSFVYFCPLWQVLGLYPSWTESRGWWGSTVDRILRSWQQRQIQKPFCRYVRWDNVGHRRLISHECRLSRYFCCVSLSSDLIWFDLIWSNPIGLWKLARIMAFFELWIGWLRCFCRDGTKVEHRTSLTLVAERLTNAVMNRCVSAVPPRRLPRCLFMCTPWTKDSFV